MPQEPTSTPTILAQNPLFCASHEFLQNSTLGWSRLHICNPHPMESDHEQGRQGINIWSGESHRNTKDLKTNNPKIPARQTIQPWDFVPDVCPHTSDRPLYSIMTTLSLFLLMLVFMLLLCLLLHCCSLEAAAKPRRKE